MAVRNHPFGGAANSGAPPTRTVVTNIAGCKDAAEAREKARALYDVEAFRSVEENAE